MIARLLFEIIGTKLDDINREIKIFSITYLIEYLIVSGYLFYLIKSNYQPGRNQGLPIVIGVISILCLGLLALYIRTIVAGIVVYHNSNIRKHCNGTWQAVPFDMKVKREQHSVGKYARVRLERYYIICKYTDLNGDVHHCRSIYFDEEQNSRELKVYVSDRNMNKYYTEFI